MILPLRVGCIGRAEDRFLCAKRVQLRGFPGGLFARKRFRFNEILTELRAYVEAARVFTSDSATMPAGLGVRLESGTEQRPAKSSLVTAAILTSASECA